MKIGLSPLNNILEKNPAMTSLGILIMFASMMIMTFQLKESFAELSAKVDYQTYDDQFRLISRGFANAADGSEAMKKTVFWQKNGWDAQLTALDILCDQPGRVRLLNIVDSNTSTNICRIVR